MKKRKRERRQELSHAEKLQLGTVLPEEKRQIERRSDKSPNEPQHGAHKAAAKNKRKSK